MLFSGGQDSATALAWSLANYGRVETLGFRYGQKHAVELDCRPDLRRCIADCSPQWGERLGLDFVVDVDLIGQISARRIPAHPGQSALAGEFASGRSYIPGRNLIFLSMSASVAFQRGIDTLVCGVSETEYSGYPDCRRASVVAIEAAICCASDLHLHIECPLMALDKAGIWGLAASLGGHQLVEAVRVKSHTCYSGERQVLHEWGYGCGKCPACILRARGWSNFRSNQSPPLPM